MGVSAAAVRAPVGSLLRRPELASHEKILDRDWSGGGARGRTADPRLIRFQESVGTRSPTGIPAQLVHADFVEKLDGAKASGRLAVEDTVSGVDEREQ